MPRFKLFQATGTLPVAVMSACAVGAALLAIPASAYAATGGIGAPDVPPINIGGTPGGQNVLCTLNVPPAGGTVNCSGIAVTLPSTTNGLQVVFSSGAGPSCSLTPGVAVTFYDPVTSVKFAGTFNPPATVKYANTAVEAGETVVIYNPATGKWTAAPSGVVTAASTGDGTVSLTTSGDPTFAVLSSSGSCAPIPGATVATTGKPFLGEGLLAGGLVLGGSAALWMIVRRRPVRHA
jgi:hypothetical protein